MMNNLLEKVENLIQQYNMIEADDVVIAGVSGGADSVCLLFALCGLREKYHFSLKVCHVNHQLRGADADADEKFVQNLCREKNIPCRIFRYDVELIAANRKQSTEEAGREVRREAFEVMCREDGGTKIASAHHSDDNAETVLLNLTRGTGLRGLCGIRPVYGKWIRPLLGISRKEIESALVREGIPWRRDLSNDEDIYTRNRIRHYIIPELCSQVNPETPQHLNELSRQAMEVWEYLEAGVRKAEQLCVNMNAGIGNGLKIRKDALYGEMSAVRKQLVHRCICRAAGMSRDVEAVHVRAVLELFERQTGKQIDLPFGVTAYRTYDGVLLEKKCAEKTESCVIPEKVDRDKVRDNEVLLKIPGRVRIPGTGVSVCCRIYDYTPGETGEIRIPQKSYTKCFDYDIIKYAASARRRRAGDFLIIGKNGEKQKLKSFFINQKIPRRAREEMLLIADGSHIMWIPGMRMSTEYQISKDTKKILEIKITEDKENGRDNQGSDPGRGSGSEN